MFAVSATLTLMLAASPGDAWTLERVVAEAVERSPEVAAARAEEAGAEGVRAADGRWLQNNPELEAEAASDVLTDDAGEQRVEVMLSQTVEVAGQRGLRVERAEAALEAARARRRAAVLEAAADAVASAVELDRREARARLAEEALGLARALEDATGRRFAAGDVPELERNGAALERARAEARAALARAEADGARAALNRRLGRPAAAPLTVAVLAADGAMSSTDAAETRDEGTPLMRAARATLPSPLLPSERPEVQAARAEESAAKAEVELLRRERFPDPTVGLGYERERRAESHGALTDLHTEHLLVARLSLPLPLWNRNQRELAEARARRSTREAERVAREREVEAEAAAARSTFEAANTANTALRAALPAVERNLELVRRAYDAGELGLDALLLARDRAFGARAEAVDAAAELARARTALLRAQGRLPTGEVPR
ncbi:TolC family protein [Pyxidicoccus fallax]|uniref:TolC family protein n=1 Tax=Pyxidicoccus fallax TaxID=394095 RepID=A0A848LD72_9BACT|nr:TolC family protein [Pyxidicoccus fallax]NMO16647.1 TolC family protein [Pyxidicoccus fallax]NPC80292.1 TolC family protein [Pyxidicoccus fallax]